MSASPIELVLNRGGQERRVPLVDGFAVVGRGVGAHLELDSPDVSRNHARVDAEHGGVVVRDLGSKNGVQVAGQTIQAPTFVPHGESFSVGGFDVAVHHPEAHVQDVLRGAGERTMTRVDTGTPTAAPRQPLWPPLVALILFALLAAAAVGL